MPQRPCFIAALYLASFPFVRRFVMRVAIDVEEIGWQKWVINMKYIHVLYNVISNSANR